MKNTILLFLSLIIMTACATSTENTLTYKEKRAQMCKEKPAFCKYTNKNIRQDSDRKYYLDQ